MTPATTATPTAASCVLVRHARGSHHQPPAGDHTHVGYANRGVAPYRGPHVRAGPASGEAKAVSKRVCAGAAGAADSVRAPTCARPTHHRSKEKSAKKKEGWLGGESNSGQSGHNALY